MSRRYRLEQDYLRQLKAEAEEDEDKSHQNQIRFTAPVHWATLSTGFSIMDVMVSDYDEIVDMLKEHYIPDDVLCRNTELMDDPVSLQSMVDHIMYTLRDTTSIKAVRNEEDGSGTLAGALLLRVSRKADFDRVFSRTILQEGEARQKCTAITTALGRQVDIFAKYNCDAFLRFYMLCIKKDYRKNGLGFQLLRIGLDVARSLGLNVASGFFNTFNMQKYAKRLGFKTLQEVSYTNWRDKTNDELIFSDPGPGNYTCAFMGCKIPEMSKPDPSVVHELSPFEQRVFEAPKTRAEKRAHLYKRKIDTTDLL